MADSKKKTLNKSQITASIAETTSLSKAQVNSVLSALDTLMKKEIGKKGAGTFAIPGLLKVTTVRKPASKAKQIPNPFKPGEMMMTKAKPARNVVKIRALKSLKDSV